MNQMQGLVSKQLELFSHTDFDKYILSAVKVFEKEGLVFSGFSSREESYTFYVSKHNIDIEILICSEKIDIFSKIYNTSIFSKQIFIKDKSSWNISNPFNEIEFIRISKKISDILSNSSTFKKVAYLEYLKKWKHYEKNLKLLSKLLDILFSENLYPEEITLTEKVCTFVLVCYSEKNTVTFTLNVKGNSEIDIKVHKHFYEKRFTGIQIFDVRDTLDVSDDILAACTIFKSFLSYTE